MRLVAALLLAVRAFAQSYNVQPTAAKQGDAIEVLSTAPAFHARMNGRTVRLFPQPDGTRLGLMPVSANYRPGEYRLDFLGDGDQLIHSTEVTIRDARFPEQDVRLRRSIERLKPAPGEMETVAALRNTVSEVRYWQRPFALPVTGCMVSPYGVRRLHNGRRTGNAHGGIDQRGAEGTPIRAIADGLVRIVRKFNVHGQIVGIDHGQGLASMYLHMSQFATSEGAKVSKGDVIGYVGSTGRSTAPHLHWTITVNGVSVNPAQWVSLQPCPAETPGKRKPRRKNRRPAALDIPQNVQ